MRVKNLTLAELEERVITIGFVDENLYTQVRIDCKELFDEHPDAIPSLAVKPPQGDAYPAVVTREGDIVVWNVAKSDVQYANLGRLQLTFVIGEIVAKSYVGKFVIDKSLMPDGEAPTPIENWITEANAVLGEIPGTIAEAVDDALEEAKESGEFDGADGVSPTVIVTKTKDGHNIVITDAEGDHSFDVPDGTEGKDGVTPQFGIGTVSEGHTADVTMTGTKENPVLNFVMPKVTTEDIVAVQDTQPTAEETAIWFPETPPTPVQVPTYAEHLELKEDVDSKVADVKYNGTSFVDQNGVAIIPPAQTTVPGLMWTGSGYGLKAADPNGNSAGRIQIDQAIPSQIKGFSEQYRPITPKYLPDAVFHGMAKAAGDNTQSSSQNPVGTYTDDAKAAIQEMLNVPDATENETAHATLMTEIMHISIETCIGAVEGKYISASNVITNNASFAYKFIPYYAGDIEIVGATDDSGIINYYDSSDTLLQSSGWTTLNKIIDASDVPSGTVKFAISFKKADINNIVIYGNKLSEITKISDTANSAVRGNRENYRDLLATSGDYDVNLFADYSVINAYVGGSDVITSNSSNRMAWLQLLPNARYHFTMTKKADTDFAMVLCKTVPAAGVAGTGKQTATTQASSVDLYFETNDEYVYLAFKYYNTSATTFTEAQVLSSITIVRTDTIKSKQNANERKFTKLSIFTCESAIIGQYINKSGTITVNSSYAYMYFPYEYGNININGALSDNGIISYWNADKSVQLGNSGWSTINKTIDEQYIPAGTKYVALSFSATDVSNIYIFGGLLAEIGLQPENLQEIITLNNARHVKGLTQVPVTILHFSDIHADTNAMARIVHDSQKFGTSIDGMICTGDIVKNTYGQISSWWNPNIMTCIGNHDSASYTDGVGYDWTALSMANRSAYYIEPFENNWGITHTSGKSYYYKDYSSAKVRLIVMDVMLYNDNGQDATDQTNWLIGLLSSAITNNLHVLIAIHAPHGGSTAKDCSFSRYAQTTMPTNAYCDTPQAVVDAVSTAITGGLKFIGYIVGHTHQDNIWDAENNGKQLMYCITCGCVDQQAQWKNSDQHRSDIEDAYNLLTIDTSNTLVKIIRGGGANIDDHMRTRKAICIDYSTGTVVGEVL